MKTEKLFNIAGKIALVTGGSKGIGFGIAEALEGRRDVPMPLAWPALVKSIEAGTSDVAKESALTLSVTFGDSQALAKLRSRVTETTGRS